MQKYSLSLPVGVQLQNFQDSTLVNTSNGQQPGAAGGLVITGNLTPQRYREVLASLPQETRKKVVGWTWAPRRRR